MRTYPAFPSRRRLSVCGDEWTNTQQYAPKDKQTRALCATPPESVCDAEYGLSIGRGSFRFAAGNWTHVKQTVVLNTPGVQDGAFALDVDGLHRAFEHRRSAWPRTMTALSTHDTKRGEDVRARLSVLAELPGRWATVLDELRAVASTGHGPFDSLLWQAIVGSWPASAERLHAYAEKAAREAGEATQSPAHYLIQA